MQLFRLHAAQEQPAEGCAQIGAASAPRKECFFNLTHTRAPALDVTSLGHIQGYLFLFPTQELSELLVACPDSLFLGARTMGDTSLFPSY